MNAGWLVYLVVLVLGIGIGIIYGSWASDEWWKERKKEVKNNE